MTAATVTTPTVTAAEFVSDLQAVRKTGRGWIACCPAHEDRSPSLSVAEGRDGRTLLHCFGGCSPEAVAAATGRTLADFSPRRARARRGTTSLRRRRETPVYGCETEQAWVARIRAMIDRTIARDARAHRRVLSPIEAVLSALNVAGIEWRCTTGPRGIASGPRSGSYAGEARVWTVERCPYCLAPDLWLYAHESEPPRFSCSDGCTRGQVLDTLETLADLAEHGVIL